MQKRCDRTLQERIAAAKAEEEAFAAGTWEPEPGKLRSYLREPDGRVVPAPLLVVSRWMETHEEDRVIAQTVVGEGDEAVQVSTVFLAFDHAIPGLHGTRPAPILYETMVFGGPLDRYQERYRTEAEARRGHRRWLARARVARKLGRKPRILGDWFD